MKFLLMFPKIMTGLSQAFLIAFVLHFTIGIVPLWQVTILLMLVTFVLTITSYEGKNDYSGGDY